VIHPFVKAWHDQNVWLAHLLHGLQLSKAGKKKEALRELLKAERLGRKAVAKQR
jgi:hypothetical protein